MSFKEVLEICNGKEDYELLANSLQLEDGELVLVDARDTGINFQSKTQAESLNESKENIMTESARHKNLISQSMDIGYQNKGKVDEEDILEDNP